jgi:hypothetical protein
MSPGEHSSGLPELADGPLLAGAEPTAAAVELQWERVAKLVEAVVHGDGAETQIPRE